MVTFFSSLSFSLLLAVLCVSESGILKILNSTEIDTLSSTGCVLLGLDAIDKPTLIATLKQLSFVYQEEPTVHIALAASVDVTWSMPYGSSSSNGEESDVAFYKKQAPDRTCLLNVAARHRHTAVPYQGQLHLNLMVSFLNEHCHAYRTPQGSLQQVGILRNALHRNMFHLQKPRDTCLVVETGSLSKSQFFWRHLSTSQPVVVRGAVKHWQALTKWTVHYLHQKYAHKVIHIKLTQDGVFEGVESASLWPGYSESWIPETVRKQLPFPDLVVVRPATDEMEFGNFLELISLGRNKTGISSYLEYSSIPAYLPELEADIEELSFAKGLLQRKHLNIWLSDGNTLGKLHFDPFDNLLCQLSGEKHLTLFEPYDNRNLYEAHIPEALLGYNEKRRTVFRKQLLQSTSMVMSPVDILEPNLQRFPLFKQAKRLQCVLKPGDVLFMPAFWWHEVQSYPDPVEQRNLAVNYWYEPFFTKEFPCPECSLEFNLAYRNVLSNPPTPPPM